MNIFTSYQRNIKINFEAYTIGEKIKRQPQFMEKKKIPTFKENNNEIFKFWFPEMCFATKEVLIQR